MRTCDTCQRIKIKSLRNRPFIDYSSIESSEDIKFIPQQIDNFKYLLVATQDITIFALAIPIISRAAKVVAEAFIHRVICQKLS